MSSIGDALKGIKQILLLQEQVKRLEQVGEKQSAALDRLADDVIAIDKRVIRIETMIEMAGRPGAAPPRIEG
jgi:hypothetical protein